MTDQVAWELWSSRYDLPERERLSVVLAALRSEIIQEYARWRMSGNEEQFCVGLIDALRSQ